MPTANGFWRPLPFGLLWLIIENFGPLPLATHLPMVFFHSVNAVLTMVLARSLGWSNVLSYFAGAFFLINFGGFIAVSTFQNSMDVMMTMFHLGALILVSAGLTKRRFVLLALFFALAAMCKETAVVFPGLIMAWWFCSRPEIEVKPRVLITGFLLLCVLAGIFAAFVLYIQSTSESYWSEGRFVIDPVTAFRQWADYLISGFFPYLHIVDLPVFTLKLSHPVLWSLRLLSALAVAILVLWCWRSRNWLPIVLLLCASFSFGPACFLTTPPRARYLYPALPFFSLFVMWLICKLSGPGRWIASGMIASLSILFIISFYTAPVVRDYRRTAKEVESFVREVKRLAPTWEPGSEVAIYDHPHPGDDPWRWVYCQLLFDLFTPKTRAELVIDTTTADTRYAYRFKAGRLTELENEPQAPPSH